MAQIFDVVYPPEGRSTFEGGLNNKYPVAIIEDNESPDCLNVYSINGAIETRGGVTQLNTTPIATSAIDGLYTRSDNSGAETMVVFSNGSAYALTGASTFVTIPSAQSVFTAGIRMGAQNYLNHLYLGGGGTVPYQYDGTNFVRHGVYPPASAVTVASGGTGLVPAQGWVYCYTFVNSGLVEGDTSPPSVTFTVSSSAVVSLTGVATAPQSYGVSARYIYRATSTAGPFLRVGVLNDNVSTSFTDNVSSASLTVQAPTDNGLPPKYSVVVEHQQRLFMNDAENPNFIWWSEILQPETVKSSSFQPFGDGSFDLVRGLSVYNNSILVLCQNSMWLYYMPDTDPTNWQVIRILSQYGSKSPYATFLYENKCMVAALQNSKFAGFAAISQSALTLERTRLEASLTGSDRTTDRIEPDMFTVSGTSASQISSVVFKNKAFISVPFGPTQTFNNRVYLFDFSHSEISDPGYAWNPFSNVNAAQFTVYGGNLYFGDSTPTGLIYQMETANFNDNGSGINSYFWTKEFSGLLGHENLQKDFRKVKLLVDLSGPYYMTLSWRTDSDKGNGQQTQVYLGNGSISWGAFNWEAANWGSGANTQEFTISLGQTSGKRIQFQFSNQGNPNQKFKVHGMNFTYNIKGKR